MSLTLNIPESLDEITLAQYQKWVKISEDKDMSTFLQQKMIEIFCDTDLRKVNQMKANDINRVSKELDDLFKEKPKFINKFKLYNTTSTKDVEFGFIPKLDDMTFGEYIDLDNYLPKWETMHNAMGVLFRPITFKRKDQYLVEDYETSSKYDISNMPVSVVFGAIVFFCNLKDDLLKTIMNYLQEQKDVKLPQELKDSLTNGVGINPFTHYATEILNT